MLGLFVSNCNGCSSETVWWFSMKLFFPFLFLHALIMVAWLTLNRSQALSFDRSSQYCQHLKLNKSWYFLATLIACINTSCVTVCVLFGLVHLLCIKVFFNKHGLKCSPNLIVCHTHTLKLQLWIDLQGFSYSACSFSTCSVECIHSISNFLCKYIW